MKEIKKVSRAETHDRFQHFTHSEFDIGRFCQRIIDERPFGDHPFYIFAHKRELGLDERCSLFMDPRAKFKSWDEVPTTRLLWQPRLTKPASQENSMLFKAYPPSDAVKVIWILPDKSLWGQFKKGKMCENKVVAESIEMFINNKQALDKPEEDDIDEERARDIYREILSGKNRSYTSSESDD